MLLRAPSRRLGNFAADWMLSEDCKTIQKDKSCDLCNCQFPKARMHVVLILLHFCDISVIFLCISAKRHRKQTLYPICPELSGTGQPVHRAKIVLPKQLHAFRSIEASGQAESIWYDWPLRAMSLDVMCQYILHSFTITYHSLSMYIAYHIYTRYPFITLSSL